MIDHASLRDRAEAALPPDVFAYFAAGAGDETTLARQEQAWDEVLLRPRVLRDVSATSAASQVLGHPITSPVLVAPTATHRLAHPEGEVGVGKAARAAGSLLVLSMRSSTRVEAVAAAAGPFWQQLYVLQDRGVTDEVGRRAAAASAPASLSPVRAPGSSSRSTTGTSATDGWCRPRTSAHTTSNGSPRPADCPSWPRGC